MKYNAKGSRQDIEALRTGMKGPQEAVECGDLEAL
jgi:hypothetical protein